MCHRCSAFACDGNGPLCHLRAERTLIPALATAVSCVLPSTRFCLNSLVCRSVINGTSVPNDYPLLDFAQNLKKQWRPSLWRGTICGWRWKVFHCPQLTQIFRNSRSLCIIHLQITSVMPLEMCKVQLYRPAKIVDVTAHCLNKTVTQRDWLPQIKCYPKSGRQSRGRRHQQDGKTGIAGDDPRPLPSFIEAREKPDSGRVHPGTNIRQ